MPTTHRLAFDDGSFALLSLRDLPVAVVVTAQLLVGIGSLVAVRDAQNGDRWRLAPQKGRRGMPVSALLTPAAAAAADAVAQVGTPLPAAVLEQLRG